MAEVYVGQIMLFGGNFAPRGFALCAGQLLPISQNTALFSILGSMYGGDGRVTFGLPNLQGNAAVCFGQGPGRADYVEGEITGEPTHTLITGEIPAHNHAFVAVTDSGTGVSPSNAVLAKGAGAGKTSAYTANLYSAKAPQTSLAPAAISVVGSGLPHENMQPYLSIAMCMALTGVFPPHN